MSGSRPGQQAGGELVSLAMRRLAGSWRQPVQAGQVLAATPGHAVFLSCAPDGSEVVVKADLSPGRAAAEHSVTAAAGAAGLPVPRIVHADDGGQGGPALLVLAYVPGVPLSPAAPGAAWADAGRVLARLHDLPVPGPLPTSLDWRAHWGTGTPAACGPASTGQRPGHSGGPSAGQRASRSGGPAAGQHAAPGSEARARPGPDLAGLAAREAADAAGRGLLTAGQAARLGRQLCAALGAAAGAGDQARLLHGDCQPAHFLLAGPVGTTTPAGPTPASTARASTAPASTTPVGTTPDRVAALIDFGDTALGDPVWDLAVLTLDDPARLGDVLAGYAPEPVLRRRIHHMIGPYRLLRCLAEANWLHEFGFDPAGNVAALRRAGTGPVRPHWPGAGPDPVPPDPAAANTAPAGPGLAG
jgi:Phosphotransferase enzyme family